MNQTIDLSLLNNYTCDVPHQIYTIAEFQKCYVYFANKYKLASALEISLIIGVIFFNSLVIFCMLASSSKKTCFDKILVGYCLVDGVTGIIDIPLYYISNLTKFKIKIYLSI